MATTTANQQAVTPSANPGNIKRILVIVIVAILAAAGAAAGMWYFMLHRAPAPGQTAQAPAPVTPIYYPLEPMTVNLQSDDGDAHFLRIGLTLKLDSQSAADLLRDRTPEIRSRILLALSAKRPDELSTVEGKHALAAELAALVSQPTEAHGAPAHVADVLFTEFVVQ
jgi:flagellar FliL protein